MAVFITERHIRSFYRAKDRHGNPILYGSHFPGLEAMFERRAKWVASITSPGDDILVVGAGFGALIRHLRAHDRRAYGLEPGPFYWQEEHSHEMDEAVIRDYLGSSTAKASLIRSFAPGQAPGSLSFDLVIDEDAITMQADSELVGFLADLEDFGEEVAHIITPMRKGLPGDSAINWKTMDEWESLAPEHIWMEDERLRKG